MDAASPQCVQPANSRSTQGMIQGRDTAVISPFSPIASAAKAPACSLTWKARAVPMPCEA